jgi:hypothetical protein
VRPVVTMKSTLRAQIGELLVLANRTATPSGMTDRHGSLRSGVRPLALTVAAMVARRGQGGVG